MYSFLKSDPLREIAGQKDDLSEIDGEQVEPGSAPGRLDIQQAQGNIAVLDVQKGSGWVRAGGDMVGPK